ncbi:hypothetical protein [Empedobacter brevis]|uniref:hypothetical protein n=1 Tax=Empedobacter brevis TaxID=247 RepID=UPI0028D895EC|nr:hypothetical protein [Empedobacter brevis]
MRNLILIITTMYFLFSTSVFGQRHEENFTAEIVILENENLKKVIDSIDLKNYYLKDGQTWYLDFRKANEIKLASSRKSRLFQPNTNVYLTIINDNIIFILSKKDDYIPIERTGLEVDLNKFNFINLTFELSSYWILKEVNGKIEIVSKSIYDGKR